MAPATSQVANGSQGGQCRLQPFPHLVSPVAVFFLAFLLSGTTRRSYRLFASAPAARLVPTPALKLCTPVSVSSSRQRRPGHGCWAAAFLTRHWLQTSRTTFQTLTFLSCRPHALWPFSLPSCPSVFVTDPACAARHTDTVVPQHCLVGSSLLLTRWFPDLTPPVSFSHDPWPHDSRVRPSPQLHTLYP